MPDSDNIWGKEGRRVMAGEVKKITNLLCETYFGENLGFGGMETGL